MGMRKSAWKAYFPDDAETADDAHELAEWDFDPIRYVERAADAACQLDYHGRDGWERTHGESFPIVVIDPQGNEHRFKGWHEPSIEHHVEEVEQEEPVVVAASEADDDGDDDWHDCWERDNFGG